MSIVRIARRAGVSTATVSRVLNDVPGVREETRHQVRLAVEQLSYVAPQIKRGPKVGNVRKSKSSARTNTIAVVAIGSTMEWLQMPVMAAAVSGISRAAGQRDLKLLLEEMPDLSKPKPLLLNGDIDGAVVFLNSDNGVTRYHELLSSFQQKTPIVWAMGGDVGIPGVDHVIADDRAVARLAFEYLTKNGCRRLAFMTTSPQWRMMRDRGLIFSSLAHDAEVDWTDYLTCSNPRDGELFGRDSVIEKNLSDLVDRFAEASPRPDGLFISNDALTALVHPMLLQRGIIPGRDVLLVSCDNEEVRLHGLVPRPVSIDINSAHVGAAAVRRLCTRIENPAEPSITIKVTPTLPRVAMPGSTFESGG